MKGKKITAKPLMVAKFSAEAVRLAGKVSTNQRRFFKVAAAQGQELEPAGVLAGARA